MLRAHGCAGATTATTSSLPTIVRPPSLWIMLRAFIES